MIRRLIVAAAIAALALAGCGGSDGGEGAEGRAPAGPGTSAPSGSSGGDRDGDGEGDGDGDVRRAPQGVTAVTLVVTMPDGRTVEWCVWLADTAAERATGLMHVEDPDLGGKAGMVFVYDTDSTGGFWMRNTRLPLSIAYLAADGSVVSTADMEPCPEDADACPTYPPAGPYRMALEVPAGRLDDVGVVDGSRVALGGACSAETPSAT